jgi:hypothetical protein
MDILLRIKRCALQGNLKFSLKARDEAVLDGISPLDVRESLVNASSIRKTLRSTSQMRAFRREHLYVIISPNLSGLMIYTKGKFVVEASVETYYLLVSCKRSS